MLQYIKATDRIFLMNENDIDDAMEKSGMDTLNSVHFLDELMEASRSISAVFLKEALAHINDPSIEKNITSTRNFLVLHTETILRATCIKEEFVGEATGKILNRWNSYVKLGQKALEEAKSIDTTKKDDWRSRNPRGSNFRQDFEKN